MAQCSLFLLVQTLTHHPEKNG
ncbi:hypothetical protein CCACVL1_30080 [Corchorus capsularis]|uniref:Uncharacterized protein n=1 Tax=Corchorus capsularis TaxID=210143 RepID=A0A1R3FYT4_COCAP|nr:hypothetical protein CCACVL1_30080 [Corchorus capsularis]